MEKDMDKDAQKGYGWPAGKQPEKETKRSFYIYSSLMLAVLAMLSVIIVFVPVDWRYALLFIATDMTIISFLLVLIKYRKDEFLVVFLGYAGIFSVATILIPLILIFLNDGANEVDYEAFSVCMSSILIFIPIIIVRWYRQLEQEKKSIPAISSSIRRNRNSLDNLTLKAKWNFPVISPEEWERSMQKMKKQARTIEYGTVIFGLALILFAFVSKSELILGFKSMFLLFGAFSILLGLFMPLHEMQIKRQLKEKNELYLETEAFWDIREFNEGKEAVEAFLNEKGYSCKVNDTRDPRYTYKYDYTYILDNGCYIRLRFGYDYSRYGGTFVTGGTIIGYKLLNYNEARELQQELDEYLTEKGIIKKREASKAKNNEAFQIR